MLEADDIHLVYLASLDDAAGQSRSTCETDAAYLHNNVASPTEESLGLRCRKGNCSGCLLISGDLFRSRASNPGWKRRVRGHVNSCKY